MTIPILSPATISLDQALRYTLTHLLTRNRNAAAYVRAYYTIAHLEYGVNSPVALAQAILETAGFSSDPATIWNNFCGLGVTDGQWRHGWAFPSIELGVRAHCAHVLAYTKTPHNTTCQLADPRHFTHNGKIATLADFNGSGWSANSSTYGDAIQGVYDAISKA